METAPVFQKTADTYEPRAHLDPVGFEQHVTFTTYPPPADLALFVEHYWVIGWDRAGLQPYVSEQVMHRPYVDVYVSQFESGIQCTFRGKRDYRAEGADRIAGARFRPGAFHAFWEGSLAATYDKTLDIQRVFPEMDLAFVERVKILEDREAIRAMEMLIRARDPQPDANTELINEIIAAVEEDGELQTVTDVARKFNRSERGLQQLFSDYVGLGIKWLLQRKKLLEAAQHIREHEEFDWAGLAFDFGYSSQPHFISDFKRVLGKTPLQYKKALTS